MQKGYPCEGVPEGHSGLRFDEKKAESASKAGRSVAEMDKVVQQNAVNAEESGTAAEEMNAQTEQMKGVVHDLVATIGGKTDERAKGKALPPGKEARVPAETKPRLQLQANEVKGRKPAPRGAREVKPDQVIPLENEASFKGF